MKTRRAVRAARRAFFAAVVTCLVLVPPANAREGRMLSSAMSFEHLPGWQNDDHRAALSAFLRHCRHQNGFPSPAPAYQGSLQPADLKALCANAEIAWTVGTSSAARDFFETAFVPRRILSDGFLTGYFEPEFNGSRHRDTRHQTPLLRKPRRLVQVGDHNRPAGFPEAQGFALKQPDGSFTLPPERGAIMDGALDGQGLELVWLADPVDAFYIHVQGSARIRLTDGDVMRVGYAGKTGHPYFAIGRVMIERGLAEPGTVTMDLLRGWLAANPGDVDAVLRRNPSYIFFREVTEALPDQGPIGAAGLPLVPGRSLAIDRSLHLYGTPIFVSARLPLDRVLENRDFRHLMIAEDTGSAIVGPARGDLFLGSGVAAGEIAGRIQHDAELFVLWPRSAPIAPEERP